MDCVLKIVYSRWLSIDNQKLPFPNGNTDQFFYWAQDQIVQNNLKPRGEFDRFELLDSRYFYNDPSSNYYFRNSNFYFHAKQNKLEFISEEQIDDTSINLYPLEIECNTIQFIIDPTKNYNFADTIKGKLLEALQNGTCKIILVNMIDPSMNCSVLQKVSEYFESLGIHDVWLLQGNIKNQKYKNLRMFDSIISLYQTANEMSKYPYQTSLGYVSDFVREIRDVKREKKFISFNRFLNRPHRVGLAHLAIAHKFLDQGYFSFLVCPGENYKDLLYMLKLPLDNAEIIKNLVPYQLDTHHLDINDLPNFFTVTNYPRQFYENSYLHIVTETKFENAKTPFFSEKTWRPILNLQPFIMMGNTGSLEKLHELGFKTFSPFIDETYDQVTDDIERFSLIEKEIVKLNNMSLDAIHDWFLSIKDILIHNQRLLKSYTNYNPLCNLLNTNSFTQIG